VFTSRGWEIGSNPQGPSDKTVWAIKLEAVAGEPIAILMNYAVHSVGLGPENRFVTGDIAGAAERYVEQYYQDPVVALWTLGAAGDQNPKYLGWDPSIDHGDGNSDYFLADAQGALLGEEVIRTADRINQMASYVRLEAEERVVTCPARTPHDGMNVQKVDSVNIRLGLILIDQIAITSISGEVVTGLYQYLDKRSPFSNTLLVTIANDRIGYIVDEAAYDTPTFAVKATPLQRGAAETSLIGGLVDMLAHYQ